MVDCGTAKGAVIRRFACPSSLTPMTTSSDKKKPARSSRNLRCDTSTKGSMRGGRFVECGIKEERCDQNTAICLHTFSDLCQTAPPVFIYLLKEGYIHGTLKATRKFKVLQQQVSLAFLNSPTVSADLFIIQCLYLLPFFESAYTEGFSHLLLSCLCRVLATQKLLDITSEAKNLASKLFVNNIYGSRSHEDRILVKLLIIFNVRLEDIVRAMPDQGGDMDGLDMANSCIEQFIFELIGKKFYKMAVDLLEHLSIHKFEEHFLYKMIEDHKFSAAEKWATFMGKPMLYLLVEKYLEMKMVKVAYGVIKTNDLAEEFPHVRRLYKETSIKKLAEKGCWDVAEMRTDGDSELIEFLIYLAMEAGYNEKVDEISDRYSLSGFKKLVTEGHFQNLRFLRSAELISEGILWVDNVADMERATNYIEDCKLVGLDCEWKPNYEKGSRPNKVSIIQIASERRAYIFDMIKLHTDAPSLLNSCLKRILHSSRILKLGYNFKCDIHQLSSSYVDLECLKYYERLLDIQDLFNDRCGGLSGVAEKVLGAGLNKTRRNSNWEQRPLSANQLEYAALDASVLVHIFCRFNSQNQIPNSDEQKNLKVEWKSHIVSRMS